jgi:hypothetical protein
MTNHDNHQLLCRHHLVTEGKTTSIILHTESGERVHIERPLQKGDLVKVSVGDGDAREWPWAVVLRVFPDSNWLGEIDNALMFYEHHNIDQGDRVLFTRAHDEHGHWWQAAI